MPPRDAETSVCRGDPLRRAGQLAGDPTKWGGAVGGSALHPLEQARGQSIFYRELKNNKLSSLPLLPRRDDVL